MILFLGGYYMICKKDSLPKRGLSAPIFSESGSYLATPVDYFTKENDAYREYDMSKVNTFNNPLVDDMALRETLCQWFVNLLG